MGYSFVYTVLVLLVTTEVSATGGRPRSTPKAADAASSSLELEVFRYVLIFWLVMLSAIFSGLTLGFMSLDHVGLEVTIGAGERPGASSEERAKARDARRVMPLREDGNLLLTTLVLGTVAVNSLLSILMADLTSGLTGFLISTVVIVLFGEIIPQALCSRHALAIGARLVPVVRVLLLVMYPVAKPLSLSLDLLVGKEVGTIFSRRELVQLLEIHARQKMLNAEEAHIVRGAMSYKRKPVTSVMVPRAKIFSLPISS
jgi:metal transporter CNNM